MRSLMIFDDDDDDWVYVINLEKDYLVTHHKDIVMIQILLWFG